MEVIGTTPGKEEVEQRQEQLSRVGSGTETESDSGRLQEVSGRKRQEQVFQTKPSKLLF